MSGKEEVSLDSSENSTLSNVQKLLLSIGHLKFSMRAISSMHLQAALFSQKESESTLNLEPLESNRLLENIINDISVSKIDQCDKNPKPSKTNEVESPLSVDELEIVLKKLQEELEVRRQSYLNCISKKCDI